MVHVTLKKYSTSSPQDTSVLASLKEEGYEPASVIAVVGKTEGNGCVNDHSRTLASVVWEAKTPEAVTIFSGGTEGVLSPHVSFLVKSEAPTGLLAEVGHTRDFTPEEVGTAVQAEVVATLVQELMAKLEVTAQNVNLVLVKCPLLNSSQIESIRAAGKKAVTTDTYDSMAKSRHSTALGIGMALEELEAADLASALENEDRWSAKASCSSGAELQGCHVLVLASAPDGPPAGGMGAVSGHMEDAIDAHAILSLLDEIKTKGGKVVQVFVKAEASPNGLVRGNRHTMLTDSDLHSTRHARGAVGGLVAGLTGDTCVYVSGGAEGQGPAGGGSLCIVYSVP